MTTPFPMVPVALLLATTLPLLPLVADADLVHLAGDDGHPDDDRAMDYSQQSGQISLCEGTSCGAPGRQIHIRLSRLVETDANGVPVTDRFVDLEPMNFGPLLVVVGQQPARRPPSDLRLTVSQRCAKGRQSPSPTPTAARSRRSPSRSSRTCRCTAPIRRRRPPSSST